MPKPTRTGSEVRAAKDRIIGTALQLIIEDGFVHFSMRRLATRLGMTAANLYNYFTGKDELYLLIQTRGFEMLHAGMASAVEPGDDPVEAVEAMIRAYLSFGMENPEYYEIMFSRNTPKYADYVGTPMERIALHEKQTALTCAELAVQAITRAFREHGKTLSDEDLRFQMIQVWSTLNGVVNLYNSRVLQEVDEHAPIVIERMAENMVKALRRDLEGGTR
jgi:AcrR family transcriptional regulator